MITELDPSQAAVADAAPHERLLVTAGAGQGKTEVVAARLEHLIDEGLSASREILVLSFSRAAVRAIEDRLRAAELARVNVRTFDSFASELILVAGLEPVGTFDERIRMATRLLAEDPDVNDLMSDLRHVVIDEVQDLVGDRADFVLAIVGGIDDEAGITVLGDPLQGIYDFVLSESESGTTFDELLVGLEALPGAQRVTLERDYRARGSDCVRFVEVSKQVRRMGLPDAIELIRTYRESLPHVKVVDDWQEVVGPTGRTGVLCRSNAEVLAVSAELSSSGIEHVVRRPARARGGARWIANALSGLTGPLVARSDVERALAAVLPQDEVSECWFALTRSTGRTRSGDQLNLAALRAAIRTAAVPLQLVEPDDAPVIVSTVHRAKGLEFDHVVLVGDGDGDAFGEESDASRLHLEYVALSRARDTMVIVDGRGSRGLIVERDWLPGRLQRLSGPRGRLRMSALELTRSDVEAGVPYVGAMTPASEVQRTLSSIRAGAAVTGVLDVVASTADRPVYDLTVGGSTVGRTTAAFGEALASGLSLLPGVWPGELGDMVLTSVETSAGTAEVTEDAGIGPSGLWLVPRIVGLARPGPEVMERVG
ncbi:Helicase IV (plasmid) [Tsukamurella tyrosinosolvens]|uniref:DNA helicase-2 / ATP-dependent DNA helicase PcrA n=1 Tax=Tsukamurella tyrosinosolvens TaxID=57704 RepID=A0A1H4R6X1_TSUTY|nr:UvrD-helicase domain-containing protein [Tsukamurella tyrosinosolvens]KXO91398.1 hypothetical protein AXK58_19495 [Tsukamurella tyrosinosolvens]SEC27566.1 DNA helicase-2 / ATP-dependent DNA helicase PcrA [Tsukamurella tyrosinosolvens]VEH92232.1 Helicase IV [Tsukamurella tyrosinosolvens]